MALRPHLYNAATNQPIPDDPANQNPKITITPVAPTTDIGDILSNMSISGEPKYIEYNYTDGWYSATVLGTTPGKILFTQQNRVEDPDHPGKYLILQRKNYLIVEKPKQG